MTTYHDDEGKDKEINEADKCDGCGSKTMIKLGEVSE